MMHDASVKPAVPAASVQPIVRTGVPDEGNIVGERMTLARQLMAQALLVLIALSVLFPIWWVVTMSVDPRADVLRPTSLSLIPSGFSLKAYFDIFAQPTANPVDL